MKDVGGGGGKVEVNYIPRLGLNSRHALDRFVLNPASEISKMFTMDYTRESDMSIDKHNIPHNG